MLLKRLHIHIRLQLVVFIIRNSIVERHINKVWADIHKSLKVRKSFYFKKSHYHCNDAIFVIKLRKFIYAFYKYFWTKGFYFKFYKKISVTLPLIFATSREQEI